MLKKLSIVLLVVVLSSIACAIPLNSGMTQPTPSQPPNAPAVFPPTATQPELPTLTSVPPAPSLPPAPTGTLLLPTSTHAPAQLSEVTIYFVAVGDNGQSGPMLGCGDSLVAVKQPIQPTSGVIRAALNKLFSYKDQNIGQSGLYNALWQSELTLGSASVADGVAAVYLTGKVMMGGECDIPRFKGQIEQTILAQPGVKQANVFLNGKPIDEALSLK
jgi:hypothetical protein